MEFTKASIRGNIDDIVCDKHPMEFRQIAKKLDDDSWPKLILVEGAPGVGKSTFAWKLCRKWNKGKILSQYKLVVLLRLRDKRVREAKTIYDLFYYDIPKIREQIVEELILSNGKETFLLFEGYDELPAQKQKDKESILVQIISGNCLPEATVLVTSRHSASGFIVKYNGKRISQHIEILGFTKENIQTYINENIKDSEERQGLERYLSCYPHIRTMMYVPLNSVIVVEVYHQCHDKDKPAPKTMTELYTSLVRTLLIRYLSDKPSYKHCTKIIEFTDLPDKVYEQLQQICKTAYRGVSNDQELLFYDLPDGFETLGLMQEVHELYVDKGDCVSYNFLHLTIQEYLAAVHLSMQPMGVQIQHFKEKKTESSFEMVLSFLSGLTKFHNYPQQDLSLILESQDHNYRQSGLNFHWLFEAQNVEYISGVLKKDVFSADRFSTPFEAYALGYCVAHSNLQWETHFSLDSTMSDMLIRGLQAEETQCKGTLDLEELEIDVNKDNQLIKPTTLRFFGEIADITVRGNEFKMECCKAIGELITSSTSLRYFTMDILPPDEGQSAELAVDVCSCLEPIVTALGQNTSLKRVSFPNDVLFLLAALTALMRTGRSELYSSVLQLLNVGFDDKNETQVFLDTFKGKCHPNTTAKNLSPAKIRSLYIKDIPWIYAGDTSFLSDLYTLSKLVIKNCDLSGNKIKCITEGFLVHCKGIDSKASDEEARSLVDVEGGSGTEQSNKTCTLEHIEITCCYNIGPEEIQHLAQALCVNTSVKTLKLSGSFPLLRDEGAKALAEMLGGNGAESSGTVNTTLEHVDLSWCGIGPVGAQHLAQALCVNTSLKTLKLKGNILFDEGAKALADVLGGNGTESSGTVNTTLEHADLSWCGIKPVGAQHLAQALCVNTSLKTLKLKGNILFDEGAKALADALGGNGAESSGNVNTTLEHVDLRNNEIDDGTWHFAQALCVNTSVKTLKLAHSHLCYVVFAEILGGNSSGTVNTTLENVDLSKCSIKPVEAQHLAQALCVNTSVKTLKLRDNPLGCEGAKAIAEMLGGNGAESSGIVNTTLEHVDLSLCRIGPVGAKHLAQALCVNTSVKTLKLRDNPLGVDGAIALAEMLEGNGAESSGNVNTTLEHVDLNHCRIGPLGAHYLAQALCLNTSVKILKLRDNPIYNEGAKALAEMLGGNGAESSGTVNTTLEHVDLSLCNIEPVGAQHLVHALCVNTSVKTLTFLEQEYILQLNWRDIGIAEQQKECVTRRYM